MAEGQLAKVRSLLKMDRPFRALELSTTGGFQSRFELRLLPVALLNADRLTTDSLAALATAWIWSEDGQDVEAIDAAEFLHQSQWPEATHQGDVSRRRGRIRT
jgi:hypothetical protein